MHHLDCIHGIAEYIAGFRFVPDVRGGFEQAKLCPQAAVYQVEAFGLVVYGQALGGSSGVVVYSPLLSWMISASLPINSF